MGVSSSDPAAPSLRDRLGLKWEGDFPHPTLVMGIVNVTPDSFQSEGRHLSAEEAIAHGLRLIQEGADLLDIGGESTRPGAETVPEDEERKRVVPVIRELSGCGVPISVDTRKASVASAALEAGAVVINDISAGLYDPDILGVAADGGAFLCLMHAPVDVQNMGWSTGQNPDYNDVVVAVRDFLRSRAEAAISRKVNPDKVWIDPGFGFGKSVTDNLALLANLDVLCAEGYPVLVGTSRKSTLGAVLGGVPPEERVEASLASIVCAVDRGARILRVHDVAASVRAVRMADAILSARKRGTVES